MSILQRSTVLTVSILLLLTLSTSLCQGRRPCKRLNLVTWNIGLEEQQATERVSSIIQAIRNSDADIIGLQEVWGGPQILRTIYRAVKTIYPHFQVVSDKMRPYISASRLPKQVYSPACPAAGIISFEICFSQQCSTVTGIPQLICAMNMCRSQFNVLYTNPICWACIFDRYISRGDPLGLNYCGAVNLPQLVSTSPGIIPNSTDAPWDHSIGLMVLSKRKYPLRKVDAAVYSEFFIGIRGYMIVATNNGRLLIANTHAATADTSLPHPPAHTFFNNTYGSWNEENEGHIRELESHVWRLVQNNSATARNAVMLGDFNMGIANFGYNVSALSSGSWYYIHGLNDSHGKHRWYDDYAERKNPCTRCIDNIVLPNPKQYVYDHIFTHGPIFSRSNLFTKRIFDEFIQITYNKTNITTHLSDHYGVRMLVTY